MMSSALMRASLLAATLSLASPALAFDTRTLGQHGSITLDDLLPQLKSAPAALGREIDQALADSNKKAEDINCEGMRFPGSWEHLGGARISPYLCEFPGKWLQIRANVRVVGKKGRVFQRVNRDAMRNADDFQESGFRWSWSAEQPKDL